eukprot:TRINITY_DN6867_c0_g1_i1.p1 TRINITY_DN6867_c0_g1~~TRINITY_DN6867_c0_g1_i1.p1  ORF type:complete len:417 (+),score=68.26 TRINITY_DN6867_c0_g1_i1:72-1322(+)
MHTELVVTTLQNNRNSDQLYKLFFFLLTLYFTLQLCAIKSERMKNLGNQERFISFQRSYIEKNISQSRPTKPKHLLQLRKHSLHLISPQIIISNGSTRLEPIKAFMRPHPVEFQAISKLWIFRESFHVSSFLTSLDTPVNQYKRRSLLTPSNYDGIQNEGPLELDNPYGIAVHPTTRLVYVADCYAGDVFILSSSLEMQSSIRQRNKEFEHAMLSPMDVSISWEGQLIAVACSRELFLLDSDLNIIGQYINKNLRMPMQGFQMVCFDSANNMYVTSGSEGSVYIFDCRCNFKKKFLLDSLSHPTLIAQGITTRMDYELLVVPQSSNFIYVYNLEGNPLRKIAIEKTGSNWNSLSEAPGGGFILTDCGLHRLTVFDREDQVVSCFHWDHICSAEFTIDGSLFLVDCQPNVLEFRSSV